MEFEIIYNEAPPRTDSPRGLTIGEVADIIAAVRIAGRPVGIKMHIQLTNSTLRAAVREVDALIAPAPAP